MVREPLQVKEFVNVSTLPGMIKFATPQSFQKASQPMLRRPLGRVKFVRATHWLKAPKSRLTRVPGNDTVSKRWHPEKADFPMLVTPLRIVTLVNS